MIYTCFLHRLPPTAFPTSTPIKTSLFTMLATLMGIVIKESKRALNWGRLCYNHPFLALWTPNLKLPLHTQVCAWRHTHKRLYLNPTPQFGIVVHFLDYNSQNSHGSSSGGPNRNIFHPCKNAIKMKLRDEVVWLPHKKSLPKGSHQ